MKVNKLVRDNIPNIIENQGRKCEYCILNDQDYEKELCLKLQEELNEFLQSKEIEELADLQEVILAIIKHKKISTQDFEELRLSKVLKNGGFDKKIYLLEKE